MADHTKKTTFAAFVNIDKQDKYWIDGHWEYSDDAPGLFRFNTKEEKKRVQDVAQSYIDNWGCEKLELVVLEVSARHEVKLKKRSAEEQEKARKELLAQIAKEKIEATEVPPTVEEAPKKRGKRSKDATM